MKALLAGSESGWRGGEHQTLLLAIGLRERGIGVTIAAPGRSALAARAATAGIPVVFFPFETIPLWTPLRLAEVCRRRGIDILHAQTSRAHTHCGIASRLCAGGAALVVSRRTAFPVSRGVSRALKYRRWADHYLPISAAAAIALEEAGVPRERMTIVPSGIETARFAGLHQDGRERERRGLDGRFVVGTVAAPTPEKGLDVLAAAAAILGPAAGGKTAGRIAFLVQTTAAFAPTAGIARIDPGEMPIERFLALLDAYVVPARAEGLSTALMAAVAAGLPVAGSRVGGIPEVAGEDHAILVPPGDPAALAGAIAALADDDGMRRRFAARAGERAGEFDISRTVEKTIAVYERLLASAGRRL